MLYAHVLLPVVDGSSIDAFRRLFIWSLNVIWSVYSALVWTLWHPLVDSFETGFFSLLFYSPFTLFDLRGRNFHRCLPAAVKQATKSSLVSILYALHYIYIHARTNASTRHFMTNSYGIYFLPAANIRPHQRPDNSIIYTQTDFHTRSIDIGHRRSTDIRDREVFLI